MNQKLDLYNLVHCDDNKYIRMSWKATLKDPKIKMLSISSPQEFEEFKDEVSKDAKFYIDHDLGINNPTGLDWARKLYVMGYRNLFLSTGYPEDYFSDTGHIIGIVPKVAPWD